MSSEEIKESLDNWLDDDFSDFAYQDEDEIEKAKGKWKRLSKKKNAEGEAVRVFENTHLKIKVMTVEDDIKGVLADGKYVFHIEGEHIAVSDYEYFKKDGCQSDWHLSGIIVFPEFMGEEAEGYFSTEKDVETTRKALLELGFVEDPKFTEFISEYMERG